MDDTISRQMAIDVLGKIFPADPMRNDYTKGITCGAALATEYIKQLPSAQQEQRWIPCSERLPYTEDGNSGILLVTCGYKNVEDTSIRWLRRLWFDGEYWNDVDGERYNQIVYAWMPLPKPWKGGQDG